jgi:DNA-binding transcriptional LysR family regulator
MRKIDLLKAMRTFMLVAQKESFSDAARELNIVTSAVSKQVSELERHFSSQLLYRTTRAMHLTSEGRFYQAQFKDIIARIDNLEDITNERQQRVAGHLCLSAPQGSASLGYLKSTSDFIKKHPDVRVSWLFLNRFVNMVEEGVDLSFRIGELADSSLIARHYSSVNVHFVASPDYIKTHGLPLHPNELSQHQCIVDSSNRFPGRWRYLDKNGEQTITVQAFIQANDGEVAARFAAEGHGVTQLPTFLMNQYLETGELVPILSLFELASVPVSLVFPANRLMNPALRTLIEFLMANRPAKM